MNSLLVFALLVATFYGNTAYGQSYGVYEGFGQGYGNGYGHGYGGYGYGVYPDQHNALRQKYVNAVAEKVGAGTGTYNKDGVPGTHLDKNHPTNGYFHHGYAY